MPSGVKGLRESCNVVFINPSRFLPCFPTLRILSFQLLFKLTEDPSFFISQVTYNIWTTVYTCFLMHMVSVVSSINPVCYLSVFVRWFLNND